MIFIRMNLFKSLLLCLVAFVSLTGRAGEIEAKDFMSRLVALAQRSKAEAGKATAASQTEVRDLSARIDFEALGKKALGARWKSISARDRREFLATLQELLELVVYPAAQKIQVAADALSYRAVAATRVLVSGKVEREKAGERVVKAFEVTLVYDQASTKIVDAVIEGEVFSENLSRQFTSALKKQSFKSIIAKMKKRVTEARARS